jgi:type IV secretory pathway TrbD component
MTDHPRRPAGRATVILGGGATYFLIVFGCGFVLGVVRTLWLVPRVGMRWAELLEIPVMLVVVYLAARWVSRRFALHGYRRAVHLGLGITALLLLLAAEFGLVLLLRGLSLAAYVASRDPVSGSVYVFSLLLVAAMPALVTRSSGTQ